jgi:WD40 repeat protein
MNRVSYAPYPDHISHVDKNVDRVIGIHIGGLDDQDDQHDMKMEVARGELDIEEYDDLQREIKGIKKQVFAETGELDVVSYDRVVEGRLDVTATF